MTQCCFVRRSYDYTVDSSIPQSLYEDFIYKIDIFEQAKEGSYKRYWIELFEFKGKGIWLLVNGLKEIVNHSINGCKAFNRVIP